MDEQKKPFDEVSIVIMLLLALSNDGAEIFFDILAATVVGVPGEAIMEPIDLVMDGIFTFWFFAKCGFGGPSILQLLDDVLELVGVPGRTICVIAGILIANNPKLAAVVETVASAETGGVAGEISKEAEVLQAGETAAKEAGSAASTAAKAEGEITTTAEVGQVGKETGVQEKSGEGRGRQVEEEERQMEPEAERSPEEVEAERLFERTPKSEAAPSETDENGQTEQIDQASNIAPDDDSMKHAEQIKERQQKLPKMVDVNEQNEGQEDNGEKTIVQ